MAVPRYKRWKRAARSAVLRAIARTLMLLPLRAALAIGAAIGWVGWTLSAKTRRQARESLAIAFPEKTAEEREAIGRASLVHLGMVAGEVISMRRWAARMDDYVEVAAEHVALLERAKAQGKGVILVMAHIGNWELTSRLSRYVQPNAAIAKRSWDRKIDELSERFRAASGVQTFWREDQQTGRRMLRLFKQGGTLGILTDQDTNVQSVFVPFFGRLAATPRAAADFALRFRAPVLVVTCHRRGQRRGDGHCLEVTEVAYDPGPPDREVEVVRLTAACTAVQEAAIRRHPAEWVWMHARWRTRPGAEVGQATTMPKTPKLSAG
jgi:Kdo2-lipid IVA lauroyltransferase/acyltransferase